MTPTQTLFRLTLRSTPASIRRVEPFLNKINRAVRLDEIQFHKIMVSLTEAVNNAIVHGNKSDARKRIAVQCELLPGWLLLQITDQGKGFSPARVGNPLKKENLTRETGLGIFLMRTLMDKVEFDVGRTGVQVRLWLNLNK